MYPRICSPHSWSSWLCCHNIATLTSHSVGPVSSPSRCGRLWAAGLLDPVSFHMPSFMCCATAPCDIVGPRTFQVFGGPSCRSCRTVCTSSSRPFGHTGRSPLPWDFAEPTCINVLWESIATIPSKPLNSYWPLRLTKKNMLESLSRKPKNLGVCNEFMSLVHKYRRGKQVNHKMKFKKKQ